MNDSVDQNIPMVEFQQPIRIYPITPSYMMLVGM